MAMNNEIEELFKSNYAAMHKLASMMLHDTDSAHDIVHDVFTAVLDRTDCETLDPGYLLACVRNRCLNRLRALDVRERFRELYLVDNSEEEDTDEWPDEEIIAALENCERSLPTQCGRVFRMRYHNGADSKQISAELGIGERAVFKHLRHALDIIKSKLNQNG